MARKIILPPVAARQKDELTKMYHQWQAAPAKSKKKAILAAIIIEKHDKQEVPVNSISKLVKDINAVFLGAIQNPELMAKLELESVPLLMRQLAITLKDCRDYYQDNALFEIDVSELIQSIFDYLKPLDQKSLLRLHDETSLPPMLLRFINGFLGRPISE
ncbi:hypothetical protein ACFL57_01855 [Candidatus Margulisiibacteriota bacterium]